MSEGEVRWITFSPRWAPHVVGEYTDRKLDPATGKPSGQTWKVRCGKCGATFGPLACDTGMVRSHIGKFAVLHNHSDPLAPKA
jgi:hypothetical protein